MEPSARELAAATPSSRDRYVDLLRVVALAAVMVGHFTMVAVYVEPDGAVEVTNSLTIITWAQWLTWVFQVMPVFFAVGGFSHAVALTSIDRRGGTYADFVMSRVDRLLRPTIAFVATGLVVGICVETSGHLNATASMVLRVIAQPLWFIGVYLAVVAFAPWMYRLHRRWGWRVLLVLAVATAVVDIARLGFDAPQTIGYLNFAFVWLGVHQCGFFYADGSVARGGRTLAVSATVGGLAATLALVWWGPYPVSMVTLPNETVSNMTPPSLALLTLAYWLMGLALLLRGRVSPLLDRPRAWTATVLANGVVMTAFLWHLTVIVAVNGVLVLVGAPVFPPIGSVAWWLLRIPLLLIVSTVLAGVVLVFRRFERPKSWPIPDLRRRHVHRDGLATLGITLALLGILGFSVAGFSGVVSLRTAELVFFPMAALPATVLLAAGYAIVRWGASPRAGVDVVT